MQNKSIQQQIQQLDVFNVVQDSGLKRGFIFYTFGALGFICMILSFGMLLMCNYQRSLIYDKYNISEWSESMQNTRIQLQIKQGDFNNYNKLSQLYEDSTLEGDVQQLYFSNDYTLMNKKFGNQQLQIIPSINYNIGDQINVVIKKNDVLTEQQMQYNNLCSDDCIQNCQQNGGQYTKQGCSNTYYAQQICFIFDQDQIEQGCFNGDPQIWQFQPTKNIQFQFRRINDPFLSQYRNSTQLQKIGGVQNYSSKLAYTLITVSMLGFLICGIILLMNKYKKQEPLEIELQEIKPPQQVIVVALNY